MSIRPIDLQVLIPRAGDVGRVQQIADHQTLLQQQQFAEQWQQINEHRQHQIQSTPKSVGGKVHGEKQSEGNPGKGRGDSREQAHTTDSADEGGTDGNHSSVCDPVRGHIVDIKT